MQNKLNSNSTSIFFKEKTNKDFFCLKDFHILIRILMPYLFVCTAKIVIFCFLCCRGKLLNAALVRKLELHSREKKKNDLYAVSFSFHFQGQRLKFTKKNFSDNSFVNWGKLEENICLNNVSILYVYVNSSFFILWVFIRTYVKMQYKL